MAADGPQQQQQPQQPAGILQQWSEQGGGVAAGVRGNGQVCRGWVPASLFKQRMNVISPADWITHLQPSRKPPEEGHMTPNADCVCECNVPELARCQSNLTELSRLLQSLEILQRTQSAPNFTEMQVIKDGRQAGQATTLFSFKKTVKSRLVTSVRQTGLSSAPDNSDQYLLNFFVFVLLLFWLNCHILIVCLFFVFENVSCCHFPALSVCYHLFCLWSACPNNYILHFVPQRPIVLKYLRKKSAWTEDGEQKVSAKMQNSSFRYYFFLLSCQISAHKVELKI